VKDTTRIGVGALAAATLLLAGCGGKNQDSQSTPATTTVPSSPTGAEIPGQRASVAPEPGQWTPPPKENPPAPPPRTKDPGTDKKRETAEPSYEVAGPTLNSEYPRYFSVYRGESDHCGEIFNVGTLDAVGVPLLVTSVRLHSQTPSGRTAFSLIASPEYCGNGRFPSAAPVCVGATLRPFRDQPDACKLSVGFTGSEDADYTAKLTLDWRARCVSRAPVECARLPANVQPTNERPVTIHGSYTFRTLTACLRYIASEKAQNRSVGDDVLLGSCPRASGIGTPSVSPPGS